ncbi:MAG TPA: ribosome recycling factor [Nitrospinota bacterium]|nr:ribosome recycling factor [Nitrospinota bacterium]|tara:strand:+ start:17207 stop:17764 length:558 start_codon:yes stop_codon:yes gene_type:complete
MIDEVYSEAKHKMDVTIEHLCKDLAGIRTGRASLGLLDGITVDYYGQESPLNQVASLTLPDPLTISVQPWETNLVPAIEKAILASDLGLTPNNDGKVIRLPIPHLTEERRMELCKIVKKCIENFKIAIRNVRRDAIEKLKKLEKGGKISEDGSHTAQDNMQKITDEHIKLGSKMGIEKENEILDR